jgi:phosphate transport system substrate-binding protein
MPGRNPVEQETEMQIIGKFKLVGVALATAGALGVAAAAKAQTVKIDGSSTVYPISEAVAEEFQKAKKGAIKVTVGISGTGGGFKKFCRGETDISDASRPILAKEMQACAEAGIRYIELPVAYDALTVVINPKNTWIKEFKVEELKKMWEPAAQGKITRWNQVNPAWPDAPLKLFGAGSDSGTFDYFTDAINGKEKASRGDYTASEDDNVLVQGVARDVNAIGYFGLAYYVENKDKLKAVPIVNKGATKAVSPGIETVMDGTYQPLARPIFIYVSEKAMARSEVREFVEYYLKHAAALTKQVGYVPLGRQHYDLALQNFKKKKLGSGFGGKPEVGVRLDDLLQREARL